MTVQALDTMQTEGGRAAEAEAEGAWDGAVENDLSGAQVGGGGGGGGGAKKKKRNKKRQGGEGA